MNKILIIFALALFPKILCAQYITEEEEPKSFYVGLGSGLNSNTGLLGGTIEWMFVPKVSAHAGLGLGSWGYKTSIGMRYYINGPIGWAFGGGLAFATGIDKLEMNFNDGMVEGQSGTTTLNMRLKPASTLNLSVLKYWSLGNSGKNRINMELGYAAAMTNNAWEVIGGTYKLSPNGNAMMNLLQPGGLMIGMGISFGL